METSFYRVGSLAEESENIHTKEKGLELERQITIIDIANAANSDEIARTNEANKTFVSNGDIQNERGFPGNQEKLEGVPLTVNKIKALLTKKVISTWRKRLSFLLVRLKNQRLQYFNS